MTNPEPHLPEQVEDTIVAPATAVTESGVAIIRLSGPQAQAILAQCFHPHGTESEGLQPRRLTLGELRSSDGSVIDECMAVLMRAPHSFTGEDVVEFHCHGGVATVSAVMERCLESGSRVAEPGEFSRRAFLNRKMDLAQSEALADLIAARTDLSRKVALQQLRGGLSGRIRDIRSTLIDTAAEMEAHLDFPEEDIPTLARDRTRLNLTDAQTRISNLLAAFQRGRMIRDGARVVLVGIPNAGKSSLFNALVGRERAIVSPHPGTTRDTIESTIDLKGIPVTLVDTAGIREATDAVEQLGIERTTREITQADLVLSVIDATVSVDEQQQTRLQRDKSSEADDLSEPCPEIIVLTKSDLISDSQQLILPGGNQIRVSVVTREGLDQLEEAIVRILLGTVPVDEVQVVRERHAQCLQKALEALGNALQAFRGDMSGEFVMVDIREALLRLGEITGERFDEEILDRIFSTFCLGK